MKFPVVAIVFLAVASNVTASYYHSVKDTAKSVGVGKAHASVGVGKAVMGIIAKPLIIGGLMAKPIIIGGLWSAGIAGALAAKPILAATAVKAGIVTLAVAKPLILGAVVKHTVIGAVKLKKAAVVAAAIPVVFGAKFIGAKIVGGVKYKLALAGKAAFKALSVVGAGAKAIGVGAKSLGSKVVHAVSAKGLSFKSHGKDIGTKIMGAVHAHKKPSVVVQNYYLPMPMHAPVISEIPLLLPKYKSHPEFNPVVKEPFISKPEVQYTEYKSAKEPVVFETKLHKIHHKTITPVVLQPEFKSVSGFIPEIHSPSKGVVSNDLAVKGLGTPYVGATDVIEDPVGSGNIGAFSKLFTKKG